MLLNFKAIRLRKLNAENGGGVTIVYSFNFLSFIPSVHMFTSPAFLEFDLTYQEISHLQLRYLKAPPRPEHSYLVIFFYSFLV